MKLLRKELSRQVGFLVCVTSMHLSPWVSAQESKSAGSSKPVLEEIIVSAQKRDQDVGTVPIAMSVLTSEDFQARNIRQANELQQAVVGLSMVKAVETQPSFAVRGVVNINFQQNTSQPVAIYVDETYKGLGLFTSGQIFDLERVEILKGPQGTVFGRNATGGAVSLVTQRPDLGGEVSGYVMGGLGDYNRKEYEGGIDVPIIEGKLAARVAFSGTVNDGVVNNLTDGVQDTMDTNGQAFRLNVLYQPTENLEILARYANSRINQSGFTFLLEGVGPEGIAYRGNPGVSDFWDTQDGSLGYNDTDTDSFGLNINYDLSETVTLTSITSYDTGDMDFREDVDSLPQLYFNADFGAQNAKAFSQDLRLSSSGDSRLQWLVGAYYYSEEGDFDAIFDTIASAPGDPDFVFSAAAQMGQEVESYAIYSHNTFDITDQLQLIAGIRYTDEEVTLNDYLVQFGAVVEPITVSRDLATILTLDDITITKTEADSVDYKLGLSYQFGDNTFAYAHVSTGFRAPVFGLGFSDNDAAPATEEDLTAYEFGVKTQLLDDRMRLNFAGFVYEYEGLQFYTAEGANFPLNNADEAELYGFELETVTQVTSDLRLTLAAAYLNSEFVDTVLGEGTSTEVDISGNQIYYAPEWSFVVGVDWRFLETRSGYFNLQVNSKFLDDQFLDAANTEALKQDAYWYHDSRINYNFGDDDYTISLWMRNIADEEVCNSRAIQQAVLNANGCLRESPRMWGVQVRANF